MLSYTGHLCNAVASALNSDLVILLSEQIAKGSSLLRWQVAQLDVASIASIRSFATQWGKRPLHVLINNAGLFTIGGRSFLADLSWFGCQACCVQQDIPPGAPQG